MAGSARTARSEQLRCAAIGRRTRRISGRWSGEAAQRVIAALQSRPGFAPAYFRDRRAVVEHLVAGLDEEQIARRMRDRSRQASRHSCRCARVSDVFLAGVQITLHAKVAFQISAADVTAGLMSTAPQRHVSRRGRLRRSRRASCRPGVIRFRSAFELASPTSAIAAARHGAAASDKRSRSRDDRASAMYCASVCALREFGGAVEAVQVENRHAVTPHGTVQAVAKIVRLRDTVGTRDAAQAVDHAPRKERPAFEIGDALQQRKDARLFGSLDDDDRKA